MTDCTRVQRGSGTLRGRLLRLASCAVLLILTLPGLAWADGDPASDVLATQPLFLPQDARLPSGQQFQLTRLLEETASHGYPLRVAVITSPSDLGSITGLWQQPATYARFLGEELSLTYGGTLLVVMPNGFGLSDRGRPVTVAASALRGVRLAPAGSALGTATLEAIQRLAASSGHPLAIPTAAAPRAAGSSDGVSWIVFGAGLVLIASAWAASLRVRPLGLGGT